MSSDTDTVVFVARVQDFPKGARHLIKVGGRSIAVFNHREQYYAMDNACYHLGGTLLNGDIEDLEGHWCVRCPLHNYPIELTTGESFYVGMDAKPGGGTCQQLKSKGAKQRVYQCRVENDGVYVVFHTRGQFESDNYARIAVANRQEQGGGSIARPSELSTGHPQRGRDDVLVKCLNVTSVCASGRTKMFYWEKALGSFMKRINSGGWVTIELPDSAFGDTQTFSAQGGDGQAAERSRRRTWTVTTTRGDRNCWFTTTVRKMGPEHGGRGGSAWLHDNGQYRSLPLIDAGGDFTIASARERINKKNGLCLLITAGVGVTPIYASVNRYLNDGFTAQSGPPLHLVHLHSERFLEDVPFIGTFADWHQAFAKANPLESPISYRFQAVISAALEQNLSTPCPDSPNASTYPAASEAVRALLELTRRLPAPNESDSVEGGSSATAQLQSHRWSGLEPFLCSFPQEREQSSPAARAVGAGVDRNRVALQNLIQWASLADSITFGRRLNKDTVLEALVHLRSIARAGAPCEPVAGALRPNSEGFDVMVMLCGPQGFMHSVTEMLATIGVPRNNILTEAFDF
jgi:nitrite reductase/ring-hydroxylating ferredoxin subunit/ferredoxin-NADP reductase